MNLLVSGTGQTSSATVKTSEFNYGTFPATACISPGAFPGAVNVPVAGAGNLVARFRGFINIPEPMVLTFVIVANDAVDVTVGGTSIMAVSWGGLGWKDTVGVGFPAAGVYPVEVRWSSNQSCNIDPLEIGRAMSVIATDNGTIKCGPVTGTCPWNPPQPTYALISGASWLGSATGKSVTCTECTATGGCPAGQTCNAAKLCE